MSDKTFVPFNTNAGYGDGSSFEMVEKLCTKSNLPDGIAIKAGAENDGQFLVIAGEKKK